MALFASAGLGSSFRPLRTLIANDLKGNSFASSFRFSTFASSLYYHAPAASLHTLATSASSLNSLATPASSLHTLATTAASQHHISPRTLSSPPFCAAGPSRRRMATWGVKANETSRLGTDRFGKKMVAANFPDRLGAGGKPGTLERVKSLFGLEPRSDDAAPMVASVTPPRLFVPVLIYRGINEETMRTVNSWKLNTAFLAVSYPLALTARYFLDKPLNAVR